MKEVEVFTWWIPPEPWQKRRYKSRWKMTREEAATLGATEPVEGSREVRQVDLTLEEQRAIMTNAWQRKPTDSGGG